MTISQDIQASLARLKVLSEHHELPLKLQSAFYRECNLLAAKIDALMEEHCPEEMTPDQIKEWARHQRPIR